MVRCLQQGAALRCGCNGVGGTALYKGNKGNTGNKGQSLVDSGICWMEQRAEVSWMQEKACDDSWGSDQFSKRFGSGRLEGLLCEATLVVYLGG